MSYVPVAGGAAAAAIAAKKKREREEEEETLASYNPTELDGWEFKIVRSATSQFKKRDVVEKVRQEEAEAGWEMLEKFDNNRIRFRRRVENRSKDQYLKTDPYRTTYGMGEGTMVILILGITFGLVGLGLLAAFMFKQM